MRSGIVVRQVPQDDGLQHGEDGGVGADAECERQHRNGREAGVLREGSQAVAKVLDEGAYIRLVLTMGLDGSPQSKVGKLP